MMDILTKLKNDLAVIKSALRVGESERAFDIALTLLEEHAHNTCVLLQVFWSGLQVGGIKPQSLEALEKLELLDPSNLDVMLARARYEMFGATNADSTQRAIASYEKVVLNSESTRLKAISRIVYLFDFLGREEDADKIVAFAEKSNLSNHEDIETLLQSIRLERWN